MYDKIVAGLGILALTVIILSLFANVTSQYKLNRAYKNSEPVTVRNEWGQLRHNPEFMCEASIRQWLKECSK